MNPLPFGVSLPEMPTVVKVLGTLLGMAGIILCWRVLLVRRRT